MSIIRDLEIKINNGEAKLSENVYVYQKDRGVELKLKLNIFETNYRSNARSILFELNNVYAAATIIKPNGDIVSRKKSVVADNTITFVIDKEFTDQVDEIGIYKIQFHLYDDNDNRITIPPIEFEVKELLGVINEEDVVHDYGITDDTLTDYCRIADDGSQMEIFSNGKYIKTIWSSGDLITSSKLNKIEEAIEYLDTKLSSYIGDDDFINVEMISYNNDIDSNITSVKDALDKLLYVDLSISLNSNTSTILEKGKVAEGITFSWSYNKKIVSQIFDNQVIDQNARSYLYSNALSSDKAFTLIANDGIKSFSESISFSFLNGVYFGVSNKTSYNSTLIGSLSKELATDRSRTFTVNCKEGQYIYYCIPTNYGTPIFSVNGFVGGFNKVNTIEFRNSHGYIESYDIYKSNNNNLGNTTVVVS